MTIVEVLHAAHYALTASEIARHAGMSVDEVRHELDRLALRKQVASCGLPLRQWPDDAAFRELGRVYETHNYTYGRLQELHPVTREDRLREAWERHHDVGIVGSEQ